MEPIDVDERRARLFSRHHLSRPAAAVDDAVAAVVGLHSSDPATVYLSARARVKDFTVCDLEKALYERRSLARMLGMRRTMFVVPRATATIMDAACTQALVRGERQRLVKMVEEQGIARDGREWVGRVADRTFDVIAARGQATATELTAAVPELASKLTFGEGKKWAGTSGVTTRVLFLLATEGRIVRGRPLGSWTSSQYRWATTEGWLGEALGPIAPPEARRELLRRWLRAFGPGTESDIRWWTGWAAQDARAALADVGAVKVQLDGDVVGYILPDDLERPPGFERRVALLPGLDPSVMGWKERDWYLGRHARWLFDTNGNAGPTVWVDGRVVGGWAQRPDATVVTRLLERVDSEAEAMVECESAELTSWLTGTRVTPRFRTPLEKELAG